MALDLERETRHGCGAPCNSALTDRGPALVPLMASGDGLPAPIIYRKGWALLGYLAVESNRMHSRVSLAALLWPTLGESSALTNLRQVLSNLNRFCKAKLGPDILRIERTAVGLMRSEAPRFDIDLLLAAPCQSLHLLTEQRVFMDGMDDIADSNFQSWLETTRQMLEARLVGAAENCCDGLLAAEQWERAIDVARALSLRDPWNNAHARRLMHAHAGCGLHSVAVTIYQHFELELQRELGLEPDVETRRLFTRISSGSPAQRRAPSPVAVAAGIRAVKTGLRMAG
ncbi:AfsR/SARP family transcriptional regulator [Stenotrophomonas pictorum]|uniref:AfsR/SARP family transcriptional regulator n=2 Tax=Stenotrophomonas pictorum TaxID=86184 RepID=UPI0009F9C921|nr:BTAD domain-containing putative transcriptional regulator [Stenotrophomonas pictorum]